LSFSTEAHWLRDSGFAVLALMRRGRGRSEGINGEDDFGREHDGGLMDISAGIAQAVEDLESAIAYGRKLPGVGPGPVLLAGQSRSGFLAMHYAGIEPGEVMGVVNFSGGCYPYGPVTTPPDPERAFRVARRLDQARRRPVPGALLQRRGSRPASHARYDRRMAARNDTQRPENRALQSPGTRMGHSFPSDHAQILQDVVTRTDLMA
jgi:dienelactone hydrolase